METVWARVSLPDNKRELLQGSSMISCCSVSLSNPSFPQRPVSDSPPRALAAP